MRLLEPVAYGAIGATLALLALFVFYLENRPDLSVWHEVELDAELGRDGEASTWAEYLELETRLFAEMEERILGRIPPEGRSRINRFNTGSESDPERWSPNWNHSFELVGDSPALGVLLLHGMSDSPYSLRKLGETLHDNGAHVLGLRLPGHGTAPSGLVTVRWEDMSAATALAIDHLRESLGDRPIYIVGYSTGGALAAEYVLRSLEDRGESGIQGMVLISGAIGVTPAAAFAVWQGKLGHFLGLEKLAWTDILPEHDPFKYASFAVNAGDQVHRLTLEVARQIDSLNQRDGLQGFPPVLAFQSAVDATVSAPALVHGLFQKLPTSGNELVLFDINRREEIESILTNDPGPTLRALVSGASQPFGVTLITNAATDSSGVVAISREAGDDGEPLRESTPMTWPEDIYSLSHIALPISPNDPLYGSGDSAEPGTIQLGRINLRGERGVIQISTSALMRQRWNPFFQYLEDRTLEFMSITEN